MNRASDLTIPELQHDVGICGSSTMNTVIEPVTVVVMIIVAIL